MYDECAKSLHYGTFQCWIRWQLYLLHLLILWWRRPPQLSSKTREKGFHDENGDENFKRSHIRTSTSPWNGLFASRYQASKHFIKKNSKLIISI